MLASPNRLTASGLFQETVRRGRRAGGPLLVVHLLVRPDAAARPVEGATAALPPRAGFVVSRAVGPAVTRNLVKRRLRHLVRDHVTDLPAGSLLVVRAQPAAATADHAELGAELTRCLGKARSSVDRAATRPEARS